MNQLSAALKSQGLTISVAESCTGGLLASHLTDIQGSSKYFMGGLVVYNHASKTTLLGVPENIELVSVKAAIAMNEGLQKLIKSDIQVSVTGYIDCNICNPELSNTIYYAIFYNCIDTVFKINLLEHYDKRIDAKLNIVSTIIDNIYKIVTF